MKRKLPISDKKRSAYYLRQGLNRLCTLPTHVSSLWPLELAVDLREIADLTRKRFKLSPARRCEGTTILINTADVPGSFGSSCTDHVTGDQPGNFSDSKARCKGEFFDDFVWHSFCVNDLKRSKDDSSTLASQGRVICSFPKLGLFTVVL